MLLAVDIGNSSIKFGLFDNNDGIAPIYTFSVSSQHVRSSDEYCLLINQFIASFNTSQKIDAAVIASVVPSITPIIKKALAQITATVPFIIGTGTKTGFKIKIDVTSQLGADLVSNSAAAIKMYSAPIIIADFGTATTLTVINQNSEVTGSVIMPGLRISLDAVSGCAELLNHTSLSRPDVLIGKNSSDSIRSGVINGHILMIDGFIRNIKEEICKSGEKPTLVACGGLSSYIAPFCRNKFTIIDNLTLIGASVLYKNNKK